MKTIPLTGRSFAEMSLAHRSRRECAKDVDVGCFDLVPGSSIETTIGSVQTRSRPAVGTGILELHTREFAAIVVSRSLYRRVVDHGVYS